MKKILTVIISAIAFGLIAGVVMVGVNVVSKQVGIDKNNLVANVAENKLGGEEISSKSEIIEERRIEPIVSGSYYEDYPSLIDDVMPTVVSITNMQKFKQNGYSMFGFRVQPQEYEAPASGSGVIVGMTDEEIIILTNNHVIESSSSLSVTFNDTETVDAAIKGADGSKDLAIISVAKKDIKKEVLSNIKVSKIGNSDRVRVGDRVIAIGNALGIGQSVTSGIISAKDREIDGIENSSKLLQTDAPINPGNSGGALVNMKGELIGINVAKSSGNTIEGMGYAIPVNVAGEVIETMSKRKNRETIPEKEQGQLGITARNIDSQTAESLDMPEGIYVYNISEDSAAAKSELKEKDIIVSFDEQAVKTVAELQDLLTYTRAGQEVSIKVKRLDGGSYVEKEFKIKLGKKKIEDKPEEKKSENKKEQKQPENQQKGEDKNQNPQAPNGGYYYDPFADFDDIFRNFGFGNMW